MKIVFFGTPDYVLPILTAVHHKFVTGPGKSPIVAVVTQSPKPVGRKQILSYSPVDKWGHEHKVPIFYSANDLLEANLDFEIGVLASYGEIIKKEAINLFPQGILVIHPSLLPKFRWGSPIPAVIITNSNPTGVSIFRMDDKFDHGPIVSQMKEEILPTDTTESLRNRLFEKSATLLTETVEPYLKGKIKPRKQNDEEATFARIFTKEEAFVPLEYLTATLQGLTLQGEWKIPFIKDNTITITPENADRFIRAMHPWPGAWTTIEVIGNSGQRTEKRLKILKAHLEKSLSPIRYSAGASSAYTLVIDEVQLEGKTPVTMKQFLEAYPQFSHLF